MDINSVSGFTTAVQEILTKNRKISVKEVEEFKGALEGKRTYLDSEYYIALFDIFISNKEVFDVVVEENFVLCVTDTVIFIDRIYKENLFIKKSKNSIKDICNAINHMVEAIDISERSKYCAILMMNNYLSDVIDMMIRYKPVLSREIDAEKVLWKMVLPMLKEGVDEERILYLMRIFKEDLEKELEKPFK